MNGRKAQIVYEEIEGLKYCPMCEEQVPRDQFYKLKTGRFGIGGLCKKHTNEVNKPSIERYRLKQGVNVGAGPGAKLKADNDIKTQWYKEKRGFITQLRKDTKVIEHVPLTDDTPLPIKSPYNGVIMKNIPGWYLLKLSGNCPKNVQKYIDDNRETLEHEK